MIEILNNWPIILAGIAGIIVIIYAIYTFIKRPTSAQLQKVKEWLLYAVTEAEKELGGGTGQIKLRYVYDRFLARFPHLTTIIPFELFSKLVDQALDKFKSILENNNKVQEYVYHK